MTPRKELAALLIVGLVGCQAGPGTVDPNAPRFAKFMVTFDS